MHLAFLFGRLETILYLIKQCIDITNNSIVRYGEERKMLNDNGDEENNNEHNMTIEDIERDTAIIIDAFKRESNWRRRNNMVQFLQGSNFLETNNNIENIIDDYDNKNNNISIQEKVLSLRPFYENITSYL